MISADKLKKLTYKALYMNTNMMISDNEEIILENCKKILEYNDIYLKVKTSTIVFGVWGENLRIDDFNFNGLIIRGKIHSIEFE